ncbi:MAG: NADPH-dependent FMN reductase, partial [Streptosporangiaceae bacterium]
ALPRTPRELRRDLHRHRRPSLRPRRRTVITCQPASPPGQHGPTLIAHHAVKNALDYLYAEWNNKAAGFVSYGLAGGARAAEHLRLVYAELQMADMRQQVTLSLLTDFENYTIFKPGDYDAAMLDTLIDQVIAWSTALAPLRTASPAAACG